MPRKKVDKVPVNEKLILSPAEACAYAGIGLNKMDELLNAPGCPFLIYNGSHRRVKRLELEKYIAQRQVI